MRFDWDPKKAALNLEKHRISFNQAITAFDDPNALIAPDITCDRFYPSPIWKNLSTDQCPPSKPW
ncbi:BrnT family toxin [Bdellovibrionota bacterium FG-1]